MNATLTRIILDATKGDLVGQAKAAAYALDQVIEPQSKLRMGVRVDGRYYGIVWNKASVRIHPQIKEVRAP